MPRRSQRSDGDAAPGGSWEAGLVGATFDLPAEVWDEYGDAETKRWAHINRGTRWAVEVREWHEGLLVVQERRLTAWALQMHETCSRVSQYYTLTGRIPMTSRLRWKWRSLR